MNPYKVLGVKENATQEEIRKAYLSLVKKYHPDKYTDSDLKELANEKLKEVNEAYDILTKKRGTSANSSGSSYGGYGGSTGYGGYNTSGSSYSGPNASEFSRVRSYIQQNNLGAAQQILDSMSIRNAEWYYLYGVIYFRQNWHDKAAQCFETAYRMEPNNVEYRNAYNSVFSMGGTFRRGSRQYSNGGGASGCSGCDVCSGLLCADCCCEAMGGDLIRCC